MKNLNFEWPKIEEVSQRIKFALESAEMNQAELSRKIGVPAPCVSRWTTKKAYPSRKSLNKIAIATGTPVNWLRGDVKTVNVQTEDKEIETRDNPVLETKDKSNSTEFTMEIKGNRNGKTVKQNLSALCDDVNYSVTISISEIV